MGSSIPFSLGEFLIEGALLAPLLSFANGSAPAGQCTSDGGVPPAPPDCLPENVPGASGSQRTEACNPACL